MGTNFYTLSGKHIGKRSAAGPYCWDCRTTLCKTGEAGVHFHDSPWYQACPKCGKQASKETLDASAGGLELGFHKKIEAKAGVRSCSSFSWAVDPEKFLSRCRRFIKDEYGRRISFEKFKRILSLQCPIKYTHSVGQEFS